MGRYESQTLIVAQAIADRAQSRKRARARSRFFRILALCLTLAGIAAGAWFAPVLAPTPVSPQAQRQTPPMVAIVAKSTAAIKIVADSEPAPLARRQGQSRRPARAPAPAAPDFDPVQILTPDELAAISQAH